MASTFCHTARSHHQGSPHIDHISPDFCFVCYCVNLSIMAFAFVQKFNADGVYLIRKKNRQIVAAEGEIVGQ